MIRAVVIGMVAVACIWGNLSAGEVRLKNGLVIQGKPAKLINLTNVNNPNPGPIVIFNLVMVQTGGAIPYQRYFVPYRQVPDDGLDMTAQLARQDEFSLFHLKGSRANVVRNLGTITQAAPFDKDGRRWVTLQTERGEVRITQGINRLTPTHAEVSSLNHSWDFGVGLNQLSEATVLEILHNPVVCKPDDAQDRMARARFCMQAGWYTAADDELTSVANDFPSLNEQITAVRQELRQVFARDILRELNRRKAAGQFHLAEDSARKIPPNLGAGITREVQRFLGELQQSRDTVDKVRYLLGDLQSKLPAGAAAQQVATMRSTLSEQLSPHDLGSLLPFLQAESDPQLTAEEKLALAYSGWILGADGADSDLARARRLWDARTWVTEYLRAEDPAVRLEVAGHLQDLEGIGPGTIKQLLQHLPPPRDAEGITPGTPQRVEVADGLAYWIVLPPEYSPRHSYPTVVALHPGGNGIETTAQWWCGTDDHPGWTFRRGFITVIPEYIAESAKEYTGSPSCHSAVIESLRDARLRFAIDSDRVFLAGHGIGGDAAFDIGMTHPDEFAGVIPISGLCNEYTTRTRNNAEQTAWYIIRGELSPNNDVLTSFLDQLFKKGAHLDLIFCQFMGRGAERFSDELPRLFDWMELHRRSSIPKEFKYQCLRQTDDRSHWVTTLNLPKNYILPPPASERGGIKPMELEARVTEGNTIYVDTPAAGVLLRLNDEIINYEKRVSVHISKRRKFHDFIKPELSTMLDDYRRHGDRRRIAQTVLQF